MNDFVIYSFKSAIWIAVFYGIYRFFFRNEIFFRFNRAFLFAGMIAPFVLALCQFRYPVEIMNSASAAMGNTPVVVNESISVSFGLMKLGLSVYAAGALLLFLYYGFGLNQIRKMIRKRRSGFGEKPKVIYVSGIRSSFSFFGYVFMDSQAELQDIEKKLILTHETAHVEQRHWIDILLAQLVCMFQWFNPFAWLYLSAVKQNHEFLADRAVINKGYSQAVYQAVLINSTFKIPVFVFTNSFYYYKFKRITIMKKNVSKPAKKLAVLLLLPALAAFLAAFAQPEYYYSSYPSQPEMKGLASQDTVKKTGRYMFKIDPVKHDTCYSDKKDKIDSLLIIVDGKESTSSLNDINPENIESVSVLKDKSAISIYGEKGKNGVIIITTKKQTEPVAGKDRRRQLEDTLKIRKPGIDTKGKVVKIGTLNSALIIVDGKEVTLSVEDIKPETIESIDILKSESATSIYGEKGKNGVIIITTKKSL
jgi:TonB-dependent SusC/RagA subfamily outer membrane receptor